MTHSVNEASISCAHSVFGIPFFELTLCYVYEKFDIALSYTDKNIFFQNVQIDFNATFFFFRQVISFHAPNTLFSYQTVFRRHK